MYRIEFCTFSVPSSRARETIVAKVQYLRTVRALAIQLSDWIAVYDAQLTATGYYRCIGQFDKRGNWFDLY